MSPQSKSPPTRKAHPRRSTSPLTGTDALLLSVILIWGSFPVLGKIALAEIPPLVFTPMRMWLAAAGLFLYAMLARRPLVVERSDWPRLVLVGVGGWAVNQITYMIGLPMTTAGNTGLMIATTPIFAALCAAILRQDRIGWRQMVGIGICFTAVALLQQYRSGLTLGQGTWKGDLLILTSAAVDGMQAILVAPLLRKYGMRIVVTWCTLFAGLALTPFALRMASGVDWAAVSAPVWGVVLWTTAINVVLANLFWYTGIRRIGGVRTTIYQYLQPIVSIALGVIALGEPLTLPFVALGALLLGGVTLARWPAGPEERRVTLTP